MASNDFDRPVIERPAEATKPPYTVTSRGPLASPLGMVLAIVFIVLLLIAVLN